MFIQQGVECFDYKKSLNVMVTGSTDHLVRIWNPYVTSKPVAILSGHHMSIVDVKLHEGLNQIFSFSRDAVSFMARDLINCEPFNEWRAI